MQMICTCVFNTSGYNVYKQGQLDMHSCLSRYGFGIYACTEVLLLVQNFFQELCRVCNAVIALS